MSKKETKVEIKKVEAPPIQEAVGVAKVPGGKWVAFIVQLQGSEIIAKDILGEPEPKNTALRRASQALAKYLVGTGASA